MSQFKTLADVLSTPSSHPHPSSAYPYPPGPSGAWAYPTPLPPPPLPTISISFHKNPRRVYLPSILSLHFNLNRHNHHHLLLRLRLQSAILTPYTVPSLQQPSQSHDFSGSTPPVPQQSYPHPHLSARTQPYGGTPLTTRIPFFPAAALSSASAGGTNSSSRKDKSKEAGPSSTVKDSVRSTSVITNTSSTSNNRMCRCSFHFCLFVLLRMSTLHHRLHLCNPER